MPFILALGLVNSNDASRFCFAALFRRKGNEFQSRGLISSLITLRSKPLVNRALFFSPLLLSAELFIYGKLVIIGLMQNPSLVLFY